MKGWVKVGVFGLVLGCAGTAQAMKASEVAPCRPNMPERMVSLPGLFTVHVVCDHVLFEIPLAMLDRDMLVNTEFAALSTGSDYVAPGSVVDSRVVRGEQLAIGIYCPEKLDGSRSATRLRVSHGGFGSRPEKYMLYSASRRLRSTSSCCRSRSTALRSSTVCDGGDETADFGLSHDDYSIAE
jgi:hypothetical protein